MAHSDDQWAIVRAYFERGLTLSEIVGRDDVHIKSKGSISKRATALGWIAGEKKQAVSKEVLVKQELNELLKQKETMAPQERNVHDALVSEQLQAVKFFRGANMLVANTVAIKVKEQGRNASFMELAQAATALSKTQEAVLGKTPDTVINNTNAVQVVQHTPEQLRKINQDLEDAC